MKSGDAESSSERLAGEVLHELKRHGVIGESLRVVDIDVRPGVTTVEGDGDEWPTLRRHVVDADVVILSTPTWLGHPASVAQRVLERLDAELSEVDDSGRPSMFGKVALVAVVGNEDGAHSILADVQQALNDIGFTLPAQGCTYWNGEAMGSTDYLELSEPPASTASATATAAANAVHLARLLADSPYPAPEQ